MKLRFVMADPAGNLTALVLDPVCRGAYGTAAAKLMALPQLKAEQVGFFAPPMLGGDCRLEMMGGEFCGNAARSVGLYLAAQRGKGGLVWVELSGCEKLLAVQTDLEKGISWAPMPTPTPLLETRMGGLQGWTVDLGGIVHLVLPGCPPTVEIAERGLHWLERQFQRGACGVIFLEPELLSMTPVVRVPSAGTTVWESSCGSGTVAAAAVLAREKWTGRASWTLRQPGGTIQVRLKKKLGQVCSVEIGGPVALSRVLEADIPAAILERSLLT